MHGRRLPNDTAPPSESKSTGPGTLVVPLATFSRPPIEFLMSVTNDDHNQPACSPILTAATHQSASRRHDRATTHTAVGDRQGADAPGGLSRTKRKVGRYICGTRRLQDDSCS